MHALQVILDCLVRQTLTSVPPLRVDTVLVWTASIHTRVNVCRDGRDPFVKPKLTIVRPVRVPMEQPAFRMN